MPETAELKLGMAIRVGSIRAFSFETLEKSTMRSFKIETRCSAHLPMGVLADIVANIADQEIGATKVDPR